MEQYIQKSTILMEGIDLEKEVDAWRHNHFHGRKDKDDTGEYLERSSQLDIAKHFFNLGIKAQSGSQDNNQSPEHAEPHDTVKQTTSLWERLKLCYKALTRDYYIFFACDKDAIQFNEEGKYETIDRRKTAAFTYVGDEPMMIAYGKVMSFHDFYWHIIEEFSKKAQQGEF